ncbi:MAG: 4Fe-4S binding protein [Paludibacteraceae bacterium]|jgi:NADH-quinone oxidoreductase subunit I|nr:4Fe-4S binding protein [Paludibacteraceae bacterium]MBO5863261.1 4Fe-4S binding protein [Paludibacteraceae bacterium]MBO5988261.1 4Fe-4S binding protein [Paludibacteraceae bacterium]MEE1542473.1 4Fe-4S binding protein [Paludibacteraceae bacterium]
MINYIKDLVSGIWALLQGMYITMLNFCRPKITEQYPENRGKKVMFERFRGELVMEHNENNEHKCSGCGICQMNCPNNTIKIITKQVTLEDGKTKKVLDQYLYDIGSCTFCSLCTQSCPQKAISWTTNFEHAVFTRSKLVKQLNKPGSKVAEKKAPAAAKAEGAN